MNSSLRVKAARYLSALTLFAASLCASAGNDDHANVVAEGARLPGDSIYQLPAAFVDQDGKTFKLADLRGRPVIVSMFYNSCQFVCPMLIDTLRATQEGLSAEERAQVSLLLVTFDPARDDVGVLKSVATRRKLDREHWTLARTDPATVRKLASTNGITSSIKACCKLLKLKMPRPPLCGGAPAGGAPRGTNPGRM